MRETVNHDSQSFNIALGMEISGASNRTLIQTVISQSLPGWWSPQSLVIHTRLLMLLLIEISWQLLDGLQLNSFETFMSHVSLVLASLLRALLDLQIYLFMDLLLQYFPFTFPPHIYFPNTYLFLFFASWIQWFGEQSMDSQIITDELVNYGGMFNYNNKVFWNFSSDCLLLYCNASRGFRVLQYLVV